jgi:hypothetical protein
MLTAVLCIATIVSSATTIQGIIKQAQGDITIEYFGSGGEHELFNTSQNWFEINLEENTYYTLIIRAGERIKYVYIDTNQKFNTTDLVMVIKMKLSDAVLYSDSGHLQFTYMCDAYIPCIQANYPLFNTQYND